MIVCAVAFFHLAVAESKTGSFLSYIHTSILLRDPATCGLHGNTNHSVALCAEQNKLQEGNL